MATYNTINTDFTGGLMSPHLRGRLDIDKFNKGLQRMENFLPSIQGPTSFRQGLEWIREEAPGNVRLIDFTINNRSRFLLALSAGLLRIYTTDGSLLYTRGGGVDTSGAPVAADDGFGTMVTVPYLDDQIMDVRYSREVEIMSFTHPMHPPYELIANTVYDVLELFSTEDTDPVENWALQDSASTPLYAGAVGSEGLRPWAFQPVTFTSHPFQKIDTSDTVLKISDEVERIRLISSASDWSGVAVPGVYADQAALIADNIYTEYKVGNQWSLGKIVEYISDTEIMVDPVESVVSIEDPSVRLAAIIGDSSKDWIDRDGVSDDEVHVRADSLIFRTSHIGSWVRIGGDRLFTNVCDPTGSAAFNSQDSKVRWGKIIDYRGVEDHPVEFIYNTLDNDEFDSGSVYEIYQWEDADAITALIGYDASGQDRSNNDANFVVGPSGGTWRFSMDSKIFVTTTAGAMTDNTVDGSAPSGAYTGLIVANMSTQRQFDVVEVEDSSLKTSGSGGNLISPSGDVTAYDLVTDPKKLDEVTGVAYATHTATVTASRIFFDESRDDGRYLLGNLVDRWVLMRINGNSILPYSVEVDVLTSIPRDELTDDLKNNGVFTQFRWGAWYENNYPSAVSFYEQRRVFAGTRDHPNLVWLSNLNDPTDFRTVESDGQVIDTTGITYQLGTGSTIISWLEAGPTLIVGTESNEWQLRPNEFSAAITPSNIRITQETSIGSRIQGRRIGGSVFFPHISGKQLHEFKFDFQTQQFVIETVTKLVPDLFEDDPIRSMSYQFHPNSTIWIVTEGGQLFSLTYRKEDDYYAWSKHTTLGTFKDVVVVPKGDTANSEDQAWFIVERGGVNELERMAVSFTDSGEDNLKKKASFLDSFTRYPEQGSLDTPATTFGVPSRCIVDGLARVVVDGVDMGLTPVTPGLNDIPGLAPDAMVVEGAGNAEVNKVYTRVSTSVYRNITDEVVREIVAETFFIPDEYTTSWEINNKYTSEGFSSAILIIPPPDTFTTWSGGTAPAPTVRRATWADIDGAGIDRASVPLIGATDHILVGLPYTGVLQMNPQAFDSPGKNAYGQVKRIVSMRPYLYKSMGYKVGFQMDNLEEIEPTGGNSLFTGFTEEHTILDSNFDVDETPLIVQDKAYPLTLVSNVIKTDLH